MKKTLHIITAAMATIVVISGKDQQIVSNDIEKVIGNKKNIDELTCSELINTIDVLKKHIMA